MTQPLLSQAVPVRKDQPHARQVDQQEQRPYPALQITQRATLLIMSLMLISCASPLPSTVSIPVAVPCIPKEVPSYPPIAEDKVLASLSDYEFVLRIAAERLELIAYSRQADIIIQACR